MKNDDVSVPCKCNCWGWGKFGLVKIRLFVTDDTYKTFWHVTLGQFSFGMSFPAQIVNWIAKVRKAAA